MRLRAGVWSRHAFDPSYEGLVDRRAYICVLWPGEAIRSPTGEIWRLKEITKDTVAFGPPREFTMDASPPDGLPSGDYSLGNDQLMRLLSVDHDRPSVKLEVIYKEGALQDLAF